ncbi:phospho-N-acetylmuramoyl-pentapeptide-transferase [Actinobacillus pleuropneumoniae]|nr:phospho-N-acetylmuramoyl-pentapeptide-transferase [Actinobacillus pleuropneumoniae]
MALLTAMGIGLWIGSRSDSSLTALKIGQEVRNDGPESHFKKTRYTDYGRHYDFNRHRREYFALADLRNSYIWFVLFVLFGYGAVGFVDDYWKNQTQKYRRFNCALEYFWLSVIALIAVFGILCCR